MKRRRTLLVTEVDTSYKNQYFTIVSEADNNAIGWKTGYANSARTISISTDEGKTWTTATSTTSGVTLATLNTGDTLMIKGTNTAYYDEGGSWNSPRANMFTSSGNFHVEGNIMSLIYGSDFKDQVTLTAANTFSYMFYNCSKLTTAENCIMPATTLTSSCYDRMFSNCTILTKAPTLPATTLVTGCYSYMFNGSRALNYIRCLAVNHSASNCTNNWVQNVASSGTFFKNKDASWNRGNSAVPTNWTLDDYGCGIAWSVSSIETFLNGTDKPTFTNENGVKVTFSSSNSSVASVNSSGEITYNGYGTCVISAYFAGNAEYDEETVTCSITIKAPQDAYFTVIAHDETNVATLIFKATDANVTKTISVSVNGGAWQNYTSSTGGTTLPSIGNGGNMRIKGSNSTYSTTDSVYNYFSVSSGNNIELCGNMLSLIYGDNFADYDYLEGTFTFNSLFRGCEIYMDITNLCIPALTLTTKCYMDMFHNCIYLESVPQDFLPAKTLASYCYTRMFSGCLNLVNAPKLPATELAEACYYDMFYYCSHLITAPELPATTLTPYCYKTMFRLCSSLKAAPELPAPTLLTQSYYMMFAQCDSLNYIKCLATNISATNCTYNWVSGVAATGTFVKSNVMTSWTTGVNGIPSGWTSSNYGTGYTINQTSATSSNPIVKSNGGSKYLSADNDIITWIHENTKIIAAELNLIGGKLICKETLRTDKTKYKDGTSITMNNVDMFVKLPEFWWSCTETSTNVFNVQFSKGEVSGWNHWEGNTFIGVYEAYNSSSKTYSRSGVTPTKSVSQPNFKTYARNRGTGYTLITWEAHCMMALLGYGWIGHPDAQDLCGYGTSSFPKTTGGRDSLGMEDTYVGTYGNGNNGSINFWGIENWWGDLYEWIDNIKTAGSYNLAVLDSSGNTVRTITTGLTTYSGCIGRMKFGSYGDLVPTEVHSNTKYNDGYCDYGRVISSSDYVAVRSGNAAGYVDGLGYFDANYTKSTVGDTSFGSRLQYKGSYALDGKDENGNEVYGGYSAIDLGLPSGKLWASCNIGASSETDYGTYYAWGAGSNSSQTDYADPEVIGNTLPSQYDTAVQVIGNGWRTPTTTEFQELRNNTEYEWITDFKGSGVNGLKLTSKTNSEKYIFIPASGNEGGTSQTGIECNLFSSNGEYDESLNVVMVNTFCAYIRSQSGTLEVMMSWENFGKLPIRPIHD